MHGVRPPTYHAGGVHLRTNRVFAVCCFGFTKGVATPTQVAAAGDLGVVAHGNVGVNAVLVVLQCVSTVLTISHLTLVAHCHAQCSQRPFMNTFSWT